MKWTAFFGMISALITSLMQLSPLLFGDRQPARTHYVLG
jgi:hypothetical protein